MADVLHRGELAPELLSTDRPAHPRRKLTWEEFLEWTTEDANAEWVDGEVIMASPVHERHDEIVNFLVPLAKAYARKHGLGRVRGPQFTMRLESRPSGRDPDLIFVSQEHASRWRPTFLDGPADLVVEVVSPESIVRDRGEKFVEYEEAGVPEYWILDPIHEQAELYQLQDSGRYRLVPPDTEGVYRSRALAGFWIRVSWMWQDPPPDLVEALRELRLI